MGNLLFTAIWLGATFFKLGVGASGVRDAYVGAKKISKRRKAKKFKGFDKKFTKMKKKRGRWVKENKRVCR